MFSKEREDFAYIFEFPKKRRLAVTMYFVFYPIDILFLNESNKIIETVSYLKPFRNYVPSAKIKTFIELPKGSIQKHLLKKGQTISWDEKVVRKV